MTVKRLFDKEEYYKDNIYSNSVRANLSEVEDAIKPDTRYNFYRTTVDKAYLFDGDVAIPFRYNLNMNGLFSEKGYFIVKTVYYKGLDVTTIEEIVEFYVALGYKHNANNKYIEVIEEQKAEYKFDLNLRVIHFVSERLLEDSGVIDLGNFILSKDLTKLSEYIIEENKERNEELLSRVVKFFYVDNLTKEREKAIKVGHNLDLTMPVVRSKELAEGLHLDIDNKVIPLRRFIGDIRDSIDEEVDKLSDIVSNQIATKINDDITIRQAIRKIAYEKYKDIIDLIKMDAKFKTEAELLRIKTNLDMAKTSNEIKLAKNKHRYDIALQEEKYSSQQVSSVFGFARDIMKLI